MSKVSLGSSNTELTVTWDLGPLEFDLEYGANRDPLGPLEFDLEYESNMGPQKSEFEVCLRDAKNRDPL